MIHSSQILKRWLKSSQTSKKVRWRKISASKTKNKKNTSKKSAESKRDGDRLFQFQEKEYELSHIARNFSRRSKERFDPNMRHLS